MNRIARKLAEKKVLSFPIISQPSAISLTLRLPSTVRIHPVFYMSQLEPHYPILSRTVISSRLPPLIVDGQPEYLIEQIIDSKYNRVRRKFRPQYHVRWAGYPISNNPSDWILADAFDDPAGQVFTTAYPAQYVNKPSPEKLARGWADR